MDTAGSKSHVRYRVWITRQGGIDGSRGTGQPPPAIALEPAERGAMSARRAARYVAAFNRAAAEHGRAVRAVALPVAVRYEGEPSPGQRVEAAGQF